MMADDRVSSRLDNLPLPTLFHQWICAWACSTHCISKSELINFNFSLITWHFSRHFNIARAAWGNWILARFNNVLLFSVCSTFQWRRKWQENRPSCPVGEVITSLIIQPSCWNYFHVDVFDAQLFIFILECFSKHTRYMLADTVLHTHIDMICQYPTRRTGHNAHFEFQFATHTHDAVVGFAGEVLENTSSRKMSAQETMNFNIERGERNSCHIGNEKLQQCRELIVSLNINLRSLIMKFRSYLVHLQSAMINYRISFFGLPHSAQWFLILIHFSLSRSASTATMMMKKCWEQQPWNPQFPETLYNQILSRLSTIPPAPWIALNYEHREAHVCGVLRFSALQ